MKNPAVEKGLFHGRKGKSGRKTIREEVGEFRAAEALLFEEQDESVIEAKIKTGKFAILDRVKLTAMRGDSRLMAKVMDKAIPNAGEEESKDNFVFQFIKFGDNDNSYKHTVSVRPINKTIPDGDMETPSSFQVIDTTSESG